MGTVNGSVKVTDNKYKVMQSIQLSGFSPALVSSLDAGVEKMGG